MKVSIISTNQENFPLVSIPNGPACIAAVLKEQGYQIEILDLFFESNIEEAIITHLERYEPELVGISLRQIDNNELFGYRSFLEHTRSIVEIVKKHSQAEIVIGGSGFTLFPEELMKYLGLPYGIAGDGENAFPLLIKYLQGEGDLHSIPGICYWDGNRVVANPPSRGTDFNSLPFPAYNLLDLQKYLALVSTLTIEGKRGCDLTCSFCPDGADKEGCRLRDPGLIADEMQFVVAEHGIRRFAFTDGIFNFPPEHTLAICREIIKRKLDIRWRAGINPVAMSREMVSAMKESGCRYLSFGIDSASEKMLESYQKGFDKKAIVETARLLTDIDIRFDYSVLLGGQGENMSTVQETLDFLRDVPQQVFFRAGIRIFKGTDMERQAREEGRLEANHDMLSPTFYLSRDLGGNFMEWLDRQCESHPNWFTITRATP